MPNQQINFEYLVSACEYAEQRKTQNQLEAEPTQSQNTAFLMFQYLQEQGVLPTFPVVNRDDEVDGNRGHSIMEFIGGPDLPRDCRIDLVFQGISCLMDNFRIISEELLTPENAIIFHEVDEYLRKQEKVNTRTTFEENDVLIHYLREKYHFNCEYLVTELNSISEKDPITLVLFLQILRSSLYITFQNENILNQLNNFQSDYKDNGSKTLSSHMININYYLNLMRDYLRQLGALHGIKELKNTGQRKKIVHIIDVLIE